MDSEKRPLAETPTSAQPSPAKGPSVMVSGSTSSDQAAFPLLDDGDLLGLAVFEGAAIGMIVVNDAGRIIRANDAYGRITGRVAADLIGTSCFAFTHPDELAHSHAAFAAVQAGRTAAVFQSRYVAVDGRLTWVRITLSKIARGHVLAVVEDVTERIEANAALQASEERLRLAAEAAQLGTWDLDLKTGTGRWNEAALTVGGMMPEDAEYTTESWLKIVHPHDRATVQAAFLASLRPGGDRYDVEFRGAVPAADGGPRWVTSHGAVLHDAAGVPLRAVGVVRDVTARRRQEEQLRESEARLQLAKQAAGIGVWDWDVARNEIAWSTEVYDLLGIDRQTPHSDFYSSWLAVMHADDRVTADQVVQDAVATGEPFAIDFRVVARTGGGIRWIRSQATAVTDDNGQPVRLTGILMDVTAQHQVEERLRERAEQLEAAVAARTADRDRMWRLTTDLMLVARFDSTITAVNPAWSALLGWHEDELLGRRFIELVHPDDVEQTLAEAGQLAAGRPTLRFVNRYHHRDGSFRWLSWTAVPDEQFIHAVARDVTAEKEQANALAQVEHALRQAQKMEAVGQLTGGIAHDFNNLLGAVVGGLELIRRKPDDPLRVRRWAENALAVADRGSKLTGQLLAFSRAQRIELRPVIVPELVLGMKDLLARTLGPMIRLTVDLDEAGVPVLCDPTQLEMAVLNLAINARDAMPAGGNLTISTLSRELQNDPELKPGLYVELAVADDGEGMSPEVAARAFDPFFTTKGVGKGTGLGLSQVYGIARQAGGTVRIDSKPGIGTTVRLYLARTEDSQPAGITDDAGTSAVVHGTATILVVDDDLDVRRVLVELLASCGYRAIEAQDGTSALAKLDGMKVDLMVVDFAMPGMNGAALAQLARQRRPDLPIVFASGYADTAAIDGVVGPAAPRLRKPFRIQELQAVIGEMLASRH